MDTPQVLAALTGLSQESRLATFRLLVQAGPEGLAAGKISELLDIPAPVRPIAWLCVGPVESFQEVPDLERFGWRTGRPLDDALLFEQYRRS